MPRLPSADDVGPSPSLESRRGIASYDVTPLARGAAAIAQGVASIGNAGVDAGIRMKRQDDAENAVFDQAKAESTFIPAHGKILLGQQDDPNPDVYAEASQAALQEAAGNIRDPRARELWMMSKAGTLTGGRATVKGLADKQETDHELAGISRSENDGLDTIVKGSPDDANTMTRAIGTRYDELAKRGLITEVQAEAYKKAFYKRGIVTRVGAQEPEDQIAAYRGAPGSREEVINRITGVESNGVATAKNPNSTATGLGQFTEGTWLAQVRAHRPDLMQGRSNTDVLALRNDAALSREMTGHLLDDNNRALVKAGLEVTPTSSYLAHFLGSGGATALLKAKPGTPVSAVLGDDQIAANRSILAGKTVDDVARWASRKMGDSSEAKLVSLLPADQREVGLRHAESLYDKQQRDLQRQTQEEAQTVNARIADDLASIEATGQGNPNLKAEDVTRLFGPQAAQTFLENRARSASIHNALDGIDRLPEAEALQRLQRLQPRPGAEGFRADQEAYSRAAKAVDSMLTLRRTDPAKAVDELPAVANTRTAAVWDTDPNTGRRTPQPAGAQAIVRARLAAQEQLGIGAPLAVNRKEADEIVRQIHAAGDDGKQLQPVVSALRRTYGDQAERVLADSFQLHGLNQDLAEQATRTLTKIGAGTRPNPFDTRNLDRAVGQQQLDNALAGRAPQAAPAGPQQPGAATGAGGALGRTAPASGEAAELQGSPTGRDISELYRNRADASVRKEFEATYGPGTAQRVIDETNRRLGVTGGR